VAADWRSHKIEEMPNRKIKIKTKKDYDAAMAKIDALMKVGEKAMTDAQADELRTLAVAANAYEKSIYQIPTPQTLEGLIELKMYEHKLKQKDLAKVLGIGASKLSEIINKKRPADVAFLKAAHEKLGIDGNLLLEYA
jgi:HTH-type transcriptional regulator/antitoxin HigA